MSHLHPDEVVGLEIMLAELESNRLEVVLTPCRHPVNSGGCIRVAQSRNAKWYRQFCARHSSDRVRRNACPDTRIKRKDTIRILERMIRERSAGRSKYSAELISTARKTHAALEAAPF